MAERSFEPGGGEAIHIGENIDVQVQKVAGGAIKLKILTPPATPVLPLPRDAGDEDTAPGESVGRSK